MKIYVLFPGTDISIVFCVVLSIYMRPTDISLVLCIGFFFQSNKNISVSYNTQNRVKNAMKSVRIDKAMSVKYKILIRRTDKYHNEIDKKT
jgi:hypothetical protein